MRQIKRIFVHCTAGSQKTTIPQLLVEFKRKGWKSPGYHYVSQPDGTISQLLPEDQVSNGVQGYNSTAINISYIGGIDNKGRAIDNRTQAQKDSLLDLLIYLKQQYPNAHIMGHRDIWGKNPRNWKKQCPCFDAEVEYANIDSIINKSKQGDMNPKIFKAEDYIDKIKQLAPWNKK